MGGGLTVNMPISTEGSGMPTTSPQTGGARCSSVVRAAHGAMDCRIDPSWQPTELFLVPASAPGCGMCYPVCVG